MLLSIRQKHGQVGKKGTRELCDILSIFQHERMKKCILAQKDDENSIPVQSPKEPLEEYLSSRAFIHLNEAH